MEGEEGSRIGHREKLSCHAGLTTLGRRILGTKITSSCLILYRNVRTFILEEVLSMSVTPAFLFLPYFRFLKRFCLDFSEK